MDEILRRYASALDTMVTQNTYAGIHSAYGILTEFAKEVIQHEAQQ